jgi:hypothetical protein
MKKLLVLLFSMLISLNSYCEWEEIVGTIDGDHFFYVDTDLIKEHNGFVYFWSMTDSLYPSETGTMSTQTYSQGDCGIMREKPLSFLYYKNSMGQGKSNSFTPPDEWDYPSPGSVQKYILDYVCNYVE